MINLFLLLFFLTKSISGLGLHTPLIILIDSHNDSKKIIDKPYRMPSNILQLTHAIHECYAPIMTTKSLLKAWFISHAAHRKFFDNQSCEPSNMPTYTDVVGGSEGFMHMLYNFDPQQWHVMIHHSKDLVLLIPSVYQPHVFFNLSCYRLFTSGAYKTDLLIKECSHDLCQVSGEDICNTFLQKQNGELAHKFSIYWSGHGQRGLKASTVKEYYLAGKLFIPFNMYKAAKKKNHDSIVVRSAHICGMHYTDFEDVVTFMHRHNGLYTLHTVTCFGGGMVLHKIEKLLNKLHAEVPRDYLYSMGVLGDIRAGIRTNPYQYVYSPQGSLQCENPCVSYKTFFECPHYNEKDFLETYQASVNVARSNKIWNRPIYFAGISLTPWLYDSQRKKMFLVPLNNTVAQCGGSFNDIVSLYVSHDALVLHSHHIKSAIHIKQNDKGYLPTLIPFFTSHELIQTYIFDTVTVEGDIDRFIKNCLYAIDYPVEVHFLIHELRLKNEDGSEKVYRDILIQGSCQDLHNGIISGSYTYKDNNILSTHYFG